MISAGSIWRPLVKNYSREGTQAATRTKARSARVGDLGWMASACGLFLEWPIRVSLGESQNRNGVSLLCPVSFDIELMLH